MAVLQEESGVGPVFVVPPQPQQPAPALGPPLAAARSRARPALPPSISDPSRSCARSINVRWRHAEIGERTHGRNVERRRAWTKRWEGWTGGPALAAALEDHRQVAMTIPLPDVRARYLRDLARCRGVGRELRAHGLR